ncbi:TfoX/Sxy family protein [Pseudoroseicyclus tamaricis]|uniref:TfoX/Sxy family protein n=1 Tax=Pseudoroseicyclus tamaricis TaxID=2705421 RepID=A0A6B2JHB5_9RHOB|nr:TfoX/Sxy family protein [Pseudoroseicyclus tamaricis]NDV00623.1 TfoX/Sxy family protein [Pseudoroseicyclus tamaricis]
MAHDEGVAELLRERLEGERFREQRMFGGLALMVEGHMVAGVLGESALFRPGRDRMEEALALPGVTPMTMGARTMGGFVAASPEALGDDATLDRLLALSLACIRALPPKA